MLELDKQISSEPVFDKLPSTLILKIFSKLNAGEGTDIRMLSRCAQVSPFLLTRETIVKGFKIVASISS